MGVSIEDVRSFLRQRGVHFSEHEQQHGTVQFRCRDGEIINVSVKGKVWFQGKPSTELSLAVREFAGLPMPEGAPVGERAPARSGMDRNIFIVYGHDEDTRDDLELLLRRMGLNPIILENLPAAGDTIIEKLENYLRSPDRARFAVVLLTPDDEGFPVGHEEARRYRARQNVILELGMALGGLGRSRVAILYKGSVELPSDIHGMIYIPFQERVEEVREKLYKELENAGYQPSL